MNTILIIDFIILWYVLGPEEVFIIIHNIDGSMLRSKKVSMDCLCVLLNTTKCGLKNQISLMSVFLCVPFIKGKGFVKFQSEGKCPPHIP